MMKANKRACTTCLHFMDDGRCHRYPPSVPVYEVTYNFVTRYPLADRDGTAHLDFPKVDELMVCGEWRERWSDAPLCVERYDELADMVLKEGAIGGAE